MIAPLGSVYTPDHLAHLLAERALEGWPDDVPPRVCDPACGDGALLRAVRAIRPDAQLTGVDVDGQALREARRALGDNVQLVRTDALTCVWPNDAFDIVIANPPWVSFSGRHARPLGARRRSDLRTRYRLFRSWPALHSAFVELAVRLAGRRAALLLPARMCDNERYGAVRAHLRGNGRLEEPATPLDERAFEGVLQPACILAFDRGEPSGGAEPIPLAEQAGAYPAFLDALPKPPHTLFADIGIHTGNCAKKLIGDAGVPVREGRDIHPYRLDAPRRRFDDAFRPAEGEYFRAAPLAVYRDIPIVLRQTADRPIAALHDEPTFFRNSVLACRGLPGVDPALLVAWLNSEFVTAYHRAKVAEAGQRTFPQLKIKHLRDLPMPDLAAASTSLRDLARAPESDALNAAFRDWLTG